MTRDGCGSQLDDTDLLFCHDATGSVETAHGFDVAVTGSLLDTLTMVGGLIRNNQILKNKTWD